MAKQQILVIRPITYNSIRLDFMSFSSKIMQNIDNGIVSILARKKDKTLELEYVPENFDSCSKEYFEHQANLHKEFYDIVYEEYIKAHDYMLKSDDAVPKLKSYLFGPCKIVFYDVNDSLQRVRESHQLLQSNKYLRSSIYSGKIFIDATIRYEEAMCSNAKKELMEWKKRQDDICFLCDSMIWRYKGIYDAQTYRIRSMRP